MKKFTIFTLLAISTGILSAENRSFDEAQALAQQFLSQHSGQQVEINTMRRVARNGSSAEATIQPYYAFNDIRNDAFVIVSATTLTRPILAYGAGQMPTEVSDEMPDGLQWWLDAIGKRTAYLEQYPEAAETEAQVKATTQAVAPILGGIAWDQTGAYSRLTPTISGQHCPTGCAATAMGQIIRYYKQPTQGSGSHSYTWHYKENGSMRSKTLSVNFEEQTYDYSLMPLTFNRNYQGTAAEQEEVSKLLYHCGVATNMTYGIDGSGTTSPYLDRAFVENFSYNSFTTTILRENYTYEEWVAIMQDELRAGRPVLYTGNSYIEEDSGHAFILEGFDNDGLYYVNWGWNGNFNAYYDIAVLNPDGVGVGAMRMDDGFCESQSAVVNITPNEGEGTFRTALIGSGDCKFSSNKSSTTKGSSISLTIRSIFNYSGIKAKGNLGLAIMQQGNVINRKKLSSLEIDGIDENGYTSGLSFTAPYTIPNDLADGTYQAYLYYQPDGSDVWDYIRFPRTANETYLQFEVTGNSVAISRPKVNRKISAADWSFDDPSVTVSTRTEIITATVTNNGDETVSGHFHLQLTSPDKAITDKAEDATDCVTLAPGQSTQVSFVYRFTQEGQWTSTLYFRPWNVSATASSVEGSKRTFDVEADLQAGATFIVNDALTITSGSDDGKIYRNSPITATLKVTNMGSDYEGTFSIWLYTKNSNPTSLTPVAKYECPTSVKGDKQMHTVTLNFQLDLDLNKNVSYYARPYYFNGSDWQLLDPDIYTKMNIYGQDDPAAGIEAVVVDEPEDNLQGAQIFNVLGKPIAVPASGELPKGIYIVNGRKMVIK
ncbi:MAG: C10 family peptidase [Bacteroidales bacterium]|nr:C10 family peptidase [Bacteroidales bacterium]